MRRFLIVVALLAASSATGGGVDATSTEAVFDFAGRPENALERQLFADAADGKLDEFSPLGAALVASGVDDVETLRRYEQKANSLADELRRSEEAAIAGRQRVEAIFNFMHCHALHGGYDLTATDLRRSLDEGWFNCISATVLFNHLAGQLGLDCRGLEMPSHVMSRVVLDGETIDVENTCSCWFQLTDDRQRQTVAASGPIGVAAMTDRSKAHEVSPIQLAAMVYYNRGVDLLAEKRFGEAAAANAKSLQLDPGNATARGNLLATINNWAIHLGDSQRFAQAVELLRRGLAIDAKFEPFAQNYMHVHHQWIEYLCQRGQFAEAIAILSRATAEMPERDYLRRAKRDVEQRWTKSVAAASETGPLLTMPCVKVPEQVE
jgi:tetratricopeptide (TPR) repeat protein